MTRAQLEAYITENCGSDPEHLWSRDPNAAIYRRKDNRKWFALFMNIPLDKLIPGAQGSADVVNLKCGPLLQGSLVLQHGFFPAYHMNKTHWITVLLDGSVPEAELKPLVGVSLELTRR